MTAQEGKKRVTRGLLVGLLAIFPMAGFAASYEEEHAPLEMEEGFPDWHFDTGWRGFDFGIGRADVRFTGGVDGILFAGTLNGAAQLDCPIGMDLGDLHFIGAPSTVQQNIGISLGGQYRIHFEAFGQEYTLEDDFPIVPSETLRLQDEKTITAYNLGETVMLAAALNDIDLFDIPIDISGVVTGKIGVSLTAGDQVKATFKRLETDRGNFTSDGEHRNITAADADVTVANIATAVQLEPDVTLQPTVAIRLNIANLTDVNFNINIPAIPVPFDGLLEEEYFTDPKQQITFHVPPTLFDFVINQDAETSINSTVQLDMTHMNGATHFMASETPSMDGASWVPLTSQPQVQLSEGDGEKRLFVKIKNAYGESSVLSDTIHLYAALPTVDYLGTTDRTPPLQGDVADPTAAVSVTVAGQTLTAVNDGDGHWSIADNQVTTLPDGIYDVAVTVTDTIGNTLHDTTTGELVVDTIAPTVGVDSLITNDGMAAISGVVNDPTATVLVQVWLYTVFAVNQGDGTWVLPASSILLLPGVYDVVATASDSVGNETQDLTLDEIVVDVLKPIVSVDTLITGSASPALTGTVDDPTATIVVTVGGQICDALNLGDGTWRLESGVLTELFPTTYNVGVSATDAAGNVGRDKTTDELLIDLNVPVVTINELFTTDPTPPLTGTVNKLDATLSVAVGGTTYAAQNLGNGQWVLPDDTIQPPLAEGVYDVVVAATSGGSTGFDATVDELIVDTQPPRAEIVLATENPTSHTQVDFVVTFDDPVAPTFTEADVTLIGTLASAASFMLLYDDPVYTVQVELLEPDAEGTIGILLGADVQDLTGLYYAGGDTAQYTIENWCGFAKQPEDTRAYVGDRQTFSVAPACGVGSVHYQWKWADTMSKAIHDVGEDAPEFILEPLGFAHAGSYWCEATYSGVTYSTPRAQLELAPHLQVVEPPMDAEVTAGNSHTFFVITHGGYPPFSLEWQYEGRPVESPAKTNDLLSFFIPAVYEENAGVYQLIVSDSNGDVLMLEANLTVLPAIPAAGMAGLGVLAGLCAAVGALSLRRRRR